MNTFNCNDKIFVIWFTGLSGAGKSTLAEKLYLLLIDQGLNVQRLDGDIVRSQFPQLGFSKKDRDEHIRRIGVVASSLEKEGAIVIASFISPYNSARADVRSMCHHFIEVYVQASLEECELRDPKSLYKKARAGQIQNFTGIDDPYEVPISPEIIIKTEGVSVENSFQELVTKLQQLINIK